MCIPPPSFDFFFTSKDVTSEGPEELIEPIQSSTDRQMIRMGADAAKLILMGGGLFKKLKRANRTEQTKRGERTINNIPNRLRNELD